MTARWLTILAALCLCGSAVFLASTAGTGAAASDWPQWRGPQRDGLSPERGLLSQWPPAGPKLLWQKSLRKDFGGEPRTWAYAESPLVDGDVLVVTPGGAQATLVALDKKTG